MPELSKSDILPNYAPGVNGLTLHVILLHEQSNTQINENLALCNSLVVKCNLLVDDNTGYM